MTGTEKLTRGEIQATVGDLGWRLVLGELRTEVRTATLRDAVDVATRAVEAGGDDGAGHLRVDVRDGRALLALVTDAAGRVTRTDLALAERITAALAAGGCATAPGGVDAHPVQIIEIGVDALDIAAVRPFWRAVTGYVDERNGHGGLIDPLGQGPALWFQQMDAPRPQRNRIHLDISVPHEEAERRVAAAVAAGGTLLTAEHAPAFWVLADPEGNEACVTTWQGRD